MNRKLNLQALVGSRICHDLVSPLGAIGNGVELLQLSGVEMTPEIALIEESVQAANARLRFFRVAYGAATEGQKLTRADIAATLTSVARGGKLSYFWEVTGESDKGHVRAVFLVLQCLERAMPYGGDITVERSGEDWAIRAQAARLKIDAPLWDSLVNPRVRPSFGAADVQFALLPEALTDIGRQIRIEMTDTQISLWF